jgi:diacylglycerol kinase family enzyme
MNNMAIIINNKAKNADQAVAIYEGFKKEKIAFKLFEVDPEHLESIIKKCVTQYKIILIGGGDGTVRTAAQYCAQTSVILGVLPLGTLNHFSKELGLPSSVPDLLSSIKQQNTITIDLAEVNGTVFINNSSIGFYPRFAARRDLYSKRINKWLSYIPSFIDSFKKQKAFFLTINNQDFNFSLYTSFLMISNNIYTYEFPLTIQREDFQKSLLGLYFYKRGKIRLYQIIRNLFRSKNNFEKYQSTYPIEIQFNDQKEVTISLDGDTLKVETPLIYKILPMSLIILK